MKPDYIEKIEADEITTPEDNDNDSKDPGSTCRT